MRGRTGWQRNAVLALVLVVVLLSVLTLIVVTGGPVLRWDLRVYQWMTHHQNRQVLHLMSLVSRTAEAPVGVDVVLLLGTAASLLRRTWWPLLSCVVVAVVLVTSVYYGKLLVTHVHAGLVQGADSDVGFPSGHATTAVVMAGTALLLFCAGWPARWRRTALGVMVAYAGLVGFSRLYLRVHRLSDVLAGWLLGSTIVLLLALAIAARLQPDSQDQPEVAPVGAPDDAAGADYAAGP